MIKILVCPKCHQVDSIAYGPKRELICSKCSAVYAQDPDTSFYEFRSKVSSQDRGLLVDQEMDFYCNDIFNEFVQSNCEKRCLAVVYQLRPKVILDIGCGNGSWAPELTKGMLSSYIGLEPSDIPCGHGASGISENILLIHNDPDKAFPIKDQSVDLVLFSASYDHIQMREIVVREAWAKLHSGGAMVIVMGNYGFWIKRFLNMLGGGSYFQHDHEHYCVHSPDSLEGEILSFIPDARLEKVDADDICIPNLPKALAPIYFSRWWLSFLSDGLKYLLKYVFRIKHPGSSMVMVFRK